MPEKIKTLIVVVGEMGMGKTHIAQLIAAKTGIYFYEGDLALPLGMELDSEKAVETFVTKYLTPGIAAKLATHNDVVVSQALYFQKHRELIFNQFKDIAQIKFINTVTTEELQIQNLQRRQNDDFWLNYNILSKPKFQKPPENAIYTTLENNLDELSVLKQINRVFTDFPKKSSVPLQQFFPLPAEKDVKVEIIPTSSTHK